MPLRSVATSPREVGSPELVGNCDLMWERISLTTHAAVLRAASAPFALLHGAAGYAPSMALQGSFIASVIAGRAWQVRSVCARQALSTRSQRSRRAHAACAVARPTAFSALHSKGAATARDIARGTPSAIRR